MDEYTKANLARWDELVPINVRSAMYDVDGFRAGESRLNPIVAREIGDVAGRSLLHLQCHFGLDTLSLARMGARVTGADFSAAAIDAAKELARDTGIDARFVCSTVDDLPGALDDRFDIVFVSVGSITWLPDLERWARVVDHFLAPGGTFYLLEFHPFAWVFDDAAEATELRVRFRYFPNGEPLRLEAEGSYTDRDAPVLHTTEYVWPHPISEVVSALAGAGLRLDFLHEFPVSRYQMFPFMEEDGDGCWRLAEHDGCVPLLYSLKATKPAPA